MLANKAMQLTVVCGARSLSGRRSADERKGTMIQGLIETVIENGFQAIGWIVSARSVAAPLWL